VEAAVLVKAPDWSDTRAWHVTSSSRLLVIVEPAYTAGARRGWTWRLPGGPATQQTQPTREQAAVVGLAAWQRWATRKETR
jgi:hypothetical protein